MTSLHLRWRSERARSRDVSDGLHHISRNKHVIVIAEKLIAQLSREGKQEKNAT